MVKITIADNWILKVILKYTLMIMFQQVIQAKFKQKLIDQILSPDKLMVSINRKSLKTDQSF
jgi:hypothetical protein